MRDVDECTAIDRLSPAPSLSLFGYVCSILAWTALTASVYCLLPWYSKVFVNAGQDTVSGTYLFASWFGAVYPFLALSAVLVWIMARKRWLIGLVTLWLPLLMGVGIAIVVGFGILQLLSSFQ